MTIQLFDSLNFEFIFRCLLAGLCGGVAGFERTKHQKAAGLRTYILLLLEQRFLQLHRNMVF